MTDYKAHSINVEACINKINNETKKLYQNTNPNAKSRKQLRKKHLDIIEKYAESYNINVYVIIRVIGFN